MDDKFLCGLGLGMLGGALLIANSVKAKNAVKSGQEMVMEKIGDLKKNAEKSKKK